MLCFILICVMSAAQAEIYKCIVDGTVVYTDQACLNDTATEVEIRSTNILAPIDSKPEVFDTTASSYKSTRWYVDHAGYQQALRVSRVQKAPIFIYAYTDWCGYCRRFESAMLPRSEVEDALSKYVKVRLNPEHSDEDQALFHRWGGTGYPTLLVQEKHSGKPTRRPGPYKNKKLISVEEFASFYRLD
jgi:thiol:disulfide interchange protein